MSTNKAATKADLQEMYSRILPYLGGSADAGFTPVGTIISMMSNHAPANYLACDGATYNKADYPELAAHLLALTTHSQYEVSGDSTKFKVPDLRGEFLRGTGTNSHATGDNGASVGSHQPPTEVPASLWLDTGNAGYPKVDTNSSADIPLNGVNVTTRTNAVAMKVSSAGALTNQTLRYYAVHPTNTSVLFCIATKNIYLNPQNDYSTDEKVIGTWIDGKTIYQKCIEIPETIPTANTTLSIILTAPANVDKYVYLGGWMITGEAAYNSIPFSYEDTWFARLCGIETSSRHEILFNCRTTNTNAIRGVAIVQYTKTTS